MRPKPTIAQRNERVLTRCLGAPRLRGQIGAVERDARLGGERGEQARGDDDRGGVDGDAQAQARQAARGVADRKPEPAEEPRALQAIEMAAGHAIRGCHKALRHR